MLPVFKSASKAEKAYTGGFLVIPEKEVPEFKKLLVSYYEGENISNISNFIKKKCWEKMK